MKMKKMWIMALLAVLISAFAGCSSDSPDAPDIPEEPETPEAPGVPEEPVTPRTVLVYMIADNSLGRGGFDRQDLRQMHEGVDAGALDGGGRLLVYYNRPGTSEEKPPRLLELKAGEAEETVLKEYPEDGTVFSTDAERMLEVLADVARLAPARDFGLVLWSHATGWLREDEARMPVRRSFGDDRRHRMSLATLADVLGEVHPSFVYFDCCLMATAEVVYELRHATDVIVASGAEVHGDGMPYHLTLPVIFDDGDRADMTEVARTVFDFYNAREGAHRWCTVSVIDTAPLDALAMAARAVMEQAPVPDKSSFQQYSPSARYRIFDMADYFHAMEGVGADAIAGFDAALAAAVVYKANTPKVNGTHAIDTYCGLGCNIVADADDASAGRYNETAWWRDVVSHNPLFQQQ